MLLNKKNIAIIVGGTYIFSYYCYKKHMHEKQLFDQMNHLLQNKAELSGIYLQQRYPFGFIGPIQWALPYHQSLKIVQNGTTRHVGLGKSKPDLLYFGTRFYLHNGAKYEKLNKYESSIPIECWVDYNKKFGHYPTKINVDMLNHLTMTLEEGGKVGEIYTATCGKLVYDLNGDPVISSCRSAVMDVIRKSELQNNSE